MRRAPRPAWLWSTDGARILWANPVGAQLFGAGNGASLAKKSFGPADRHRRQITQLAGRLPPNGAVRLERLRGFGAAPGMLATCACSRLEFPDGSHGILITAAGMPTGRTMPLVERLQRLVQDVETPIAAFARDGMLIGASDSARPLLGFRNLSEAGLDEAREDALKEGRVETPVGIGHMVLQRVGSGTDIGLVALIQPGATAAAHAHHVAPLLPEVARDEQAEPAAWRCTRRPNTKRRPNRAKRRPNSHCSTNSPNRPRSDRSRRRWTRHSEGVHQAAPEPAETAKSEAASVEPPQPESSQDEMRSVESLQVEASPEVMPNAEASEHEPSPYVEAVADEDEVAPSPIEEPLLPAIADEVAPAPAHELRPAPAVEAPAPAVAAEPAKAPPWLDEPLPDTRRHPLRFMWQMDA